MTSRERVLVLSTSYPATPENPSGHFVRSHAQALERAGAAVHVLAPGPRSIVPVLEHGIWVQRLGATRLFGWPGAGERAKERPHTMLEALPFAMRVRACAEALGPFNRVVAHWMVPTAFPLLAYAETGEGALRESALEVVAHGADVRLLGTMPPRLRSMLAARLCAREAHFSFVASSLRERFLQSLPELLARRVSERSEVRPCPISVPERGALADPRPLATRKEPYVVWVGRDVPLKRLDLAIAAASEAHVRLVVVGAHEPATEGKRSAGANVVFVGTRPRDQTLAWIAHASVLLSTSRAEGAPTAAREARALGVRVIACRAGDLAAWAGIDDGISLVDPDAHEIARALVANGAA